MSGLMVELVKSNTDLQKQVLEICKNNNNNTNSNNNNHNNNTTQSHNNNKTFNLQFFLNEECKDAMNLSEFVKVKAVKDVDKKASKLLITDWKDANPDLTNSKSNQNKQFIN
jgi:hypothetical protein